MEKCEETQAAYTDKEEKVMPEHDKMGLVQALKILHSLRDILREDSEFLGRPYFQSVADALDTIFEWIDNAVLLFNKIGSHVDDPSKGTKA